MADDSVQHRSFSEVNDRLKEIADAVADEQMPLDDALGLFEEAVGLGMRASSLLEDNLEVAPGAPQDADASSRA